MEEAEILTHCDGQVFVFFPDKLVSGVLEGNRECCFIPIQYSMDLYVIVIRVVMKELDFPGKYIRLIATNVQGQIKLARSLSRPFTFHVSSLIWP